MPMDIASILFEEIAAGDSGEVPLDQLYEAMDRLVASKAEKLDTNPNQLVRIVHEGKITWMTARQAESYLRSESEDEKEQKLKTHVESALKGEARVLHQELRILLAIAAGTFKDYRSQGLVDDREAQKIEPSLRRREDEISETFTQLCEIESRIATVRKQQPLLADFEKRMGLLLNLQKEGKTDEARELAKQLVQDRKKYMLLTHALEPEVNTGYFHRLNAHKIKKRILNVQRNLCMKKEGVLTLHLDELRSQMQTIREEKTQAEAAESDEEPKHADILRKILAQMVKTDQEMQETRGELRAITTETRVLRKQEAQADEVIEHISTNVLQDQDASVDIQAQVRQVQMRRKTQPSKAEPKKPDGSRMATIQRHR